MIQLVSPNLTTTGRIGYCLEYAENVCSAPHLEPNAYVAGQNTKFKHFDSNFPVDVICVQWYEYWLDGERLDHVTINVPGKGIYSSPWKQGTDHAILPSIAEVERIYGVKYLFWSEDISTVRVIKETDMLTPQQVDHVLKMGLRREPTAEELNNPDFANDAGLLIDTVWNNGGEAFYTTPPTPPVVIPPADPNSVVVTKDGFWAAFKKFLGL